jgi:imidazolonepropionase-like amidohydrolase
VFRLALLSMLFGSLGVQGQQRPVAFVDVTVVPMDRERLLPRQTVITQDGRITALGPARTIRVPKGTQRIDGRGRYLMPGLADMHVHLNVLGTDGLLKNEEYATLFVSNGVTTVRNMWGNPDTLAFRRAIEQGSVIEIYTTGPLTDGKPPIRPLSRVVETVSQAIEAVTSDKREGYDAVKVYNHLSPEVYQAVVSTARTLGLPVYGHVPDRVGVESVLAARQDSIEHVEGYLDALDHDDSPAKASELVSATRLAGTWNCVTLVFFQGAVPADEAARLLAKPSMRFVPLALTSQWKNNPQLASLTPYQFGRLRLYDQKRIKFVRALHDGGAKILLGTDYSKSVYRSGICDPGGNAKSRQLFERSILKCQPNTVIHKPRAFLSNANGPVNFVARNAVFAIHNLPHCEQPFVQADRRILEYRARLGSELPGVVGHTALPAVILL